MYSILTSYFYMVIPGKYAINYYICAGLNPDVDPYDEDKVVCLVNLVNLKLANVKKLKLNNA